jgi:hypothetical protein
MLNLQDLLDAYMAQERIHNFEGERGVRRLEKILSTLDPNYVWLENFFADNSGACEALLTWVARQDLQEWRDSVESHLNVD